MVYEARNSRWGDGLLFNGRRYPDPKSLHAASDPRRRVPLATFKIRLLRRRETGAHLEQATIEECLYTAAADYRRKHGIRRTWVEIDGHRADAADLFEASSKAVDYAVFRQRLKRLEDQSLLTRESVAHAGCLDRPHWISFYGGGRRRSFIYEGEDYPDQSGRSFSSVAAFLRTVDRYDDRGHIWDRLNSGWPMDSALSEPVLPATERSGIIYLITQLSTGLVYVGLTIGTLSVRWQHHLANAQRGAPNVLARAIRVDGPDGFTIEAVEVDLAWDELGAREKSWISALGCITPNGLNSSGGGQVGGAKRKAVEIDGETFPSHTEAYRVLAERLGVPAHVVGRRHRHGRPLAKKARRKSDHPEAGTTLWRRWKGLLNSVEKGVRQGPIDPRWEDYDAFAADVRPTYDEDLEMVRIDAAKGWGPGNFAWITRAERIAQTHGKAIAAGGVAYKSVQALARASGVGVSTIKYRLSKGCSPDEAISGPFGPTSAKARASFMFEGVAYPSLSRAAKEAARLYGISFDTARDRIRGGRGFEDLCASGTDTTS